MKAGPRQAQHLSPQRESAHSKIWSITCSGQQNLHPFMLELYIVMTSQMAQGSCCTHVGNTSEHCSETHSPARTISSQLQEAGRVSTLTAKQAATQGLTWREDQPGQAPPSHTNPSQAHQSRHSLALHRVTPAPSCQGVQAALHAQRAPGHVCSQASPVDGAILEVEVLDGGLAFLDSGKASPPPVAVCPGHPGDRPGLRHDGYYWVSIILES